MSKIAFCLIAAGLIATAPWALAKDNATRPPAKPGSAAAQQAAVPTEGGINFAKSNAPLEVTADQGIEFSQDAKEVIAHVNARATRGNDTVIGDTLIAYYRNKAKPATPSADTTHAPATAEAKPPASGGTDDMSGSEVWRVVADGKVEIFNPTQHAYGDHADYNVDDAVVVMTGDHLKMTTSVDIITAKDTLEYWEGKRQAVARGNAVAVRGEKRIQADVLVADFGENEQKQMVVDTAHGYDHVIMTTANDVVTGDRADYVVETGIVTVTGSVKMTDRKGNQTNGGYAVVNLNTGISTVYPAPPGSKTGDHQVKALLMPQKKPTQPAPAGH
jgi:lipopolysaccharide export system protein LptA